MEAEPEKSIIQKRTKSFIEIIKSIFLPTGYPNTVTPDYLIYQLWTIPTHITGWVSVSLVTSSLLKAVGISGTAVQATAATAAIKWITKDGVGVLGRLLVGGRFGDVFDEDPRRWRMVAEGIVTVGLSLEIATAFFPGNFLLLAGTGNFAKAFGKGLGKPAFRVIQQHFARNNNVGEVAAKEESWEVLGQFIGLIVSVGILTLLNDAESWKSVLIVWIVFDVSHVLLRYVALKSLRLDSINLQRAKRIIKAHIKSHELPDVTQENKEENFLLDWAILGPEIHFGTSLSFIINHQLINSDFERWNEIFENEKYLLSWHESKGYVILKEEYEDIDCLRALWLGEWLYEKNIVNALNSDFELGLSVLNREFEDFKMQVKRQGWDLSNIVIRKSKSRIKSI